MCGSRALAPCVARGDRASQVFRAVGRAGVLAAEGAPSAALPTPPTCFSTFPRRPIMLGSSGSSASAGPLVRSLSVMAGPRPTIWSTLPGREPPSMSSGDSGAARGPLHLGQATAPQGQPTGGAAGCQDRWAPGARFSPCSPNPGPATAHAIPAGRHVSEEQREGGRALRPRPRPSRRPAPARASLLHPAPLSPRPAPTGSGGDRGKRLLQHRQKQEARAAPCGRTGARGTGRRGGAHTQPGPVRARTCTCVCTRVLCAHVHTVCVCVFARCIEHTCSLCVCTHVLPVCAYTVCAHMCLPCMHVCTCACYVHVCARVLAPCTCCCMHVYACAFSVCSYMCGMQNTAELTSMEAIGHECQHEGQRLPSIRPVRCPLTPVLKRKGPRRARGGRGCANAHSAAMVTAVCTPPPACQGAAEGVRAPG